MPIRFLIVFLLLAGTGFAQTFNGLIDGYYSANFKNPINRRNAFRAFDINHNEFSLSYAELAIEQKPMPVGFRVDIGFGDTAKVVNSFEPSTSAFYEHVQQAYLSANSGGLTVDFGKFVTPLGAEVIESKDNWNYSRSILFNWAIPYYHFGVRSTYAAGDKVSVGATVTNGWNNVRDNNSGKTVGFMATLKPGKLTWTANYMVGDELGEGEYRHTIDSTAIVDINDKFSLMANYDYGLDNSFGASHWQGFAAYAKFTATPKFVVVPRYEYFADSQGFATGTSQKMQEFTITTKFPLHEQLTLFAEYRHDWSDADVFPGRDSDDLPTLEGIQDTVAFGVVFTISRGR